MFFTKKYFSIQKISFAGIGIDPMAKDPQLQIRRPLILYGVMMSCSFHFLLVAHYAWKHITDFVEITDSLPLLCQLLLSIWKILIFLNKRLEITSLIQELHGLNYKVKEQEMAIVRRENFKDHRLTSFYFKIVAITGGTALIHPIVNALYNYYSKGELVLNPPNKATYFWNHTHLSGFSVVYVMNAFSDYFTCAASLAIDTLFSWFVSNITAQFHIICYRFQQLALKCSESVNRLHQQQQQQNDLNENFQYSIQYHRQTLLLAEKLNRVYGEIIFIKFIIVCTEICSLVFRVSRPNDSVADVAYKCAFLFAVALQLIVYCYNGQRIKDESLQVATKIYCAFDWSNLSKSYQKLLLICLLRSQKYSIIKGVFFEVDLSLYLWVFKTAGSLITALKSLDEKD
ncbi:odorant receptor 45a-like isoform 1-T1 [Cochliomyia hominivorax]